jgi:hypothetical protein
MRPGIKTGFPLLLTQERREGFREERREEERQSGTLREG